jgi:prefoldin subunit 5
MKDPEPKRENSDLEKILTAVEELQTTVTGLQTTVTGLQTTVTGLQTTVNGLNERVSTQEQVGVLYEISARQEVARRFGQYHCEREAKQCYRLYDRIQM